MNWFSSSTKKSTKNSNDISVLRSSVKMLDKRINAINLMSTKHMNEIETLNEHVNALNNCTKLITGVSMCTDPIYPSKKLNELTTRDVIGEGEGIGFCIGTENIADIPMFQNNEIIKMSTAIDHDLPGNYLCVANNYLKDYVDSFVPTVMRNTLRDMNQPLHLAEKSMKCGAECKDACSNLEDPNVCALCPPMEQFKCNPWVM